jgi:hypothetical protein
MFDVAGGVDGVVQELGREVLGPMKMPTKTADMVKTMKKR